MPTRLNGADLNIANGIREFAIASPGAIAVVDGDRSLNYAALGERSSRLANNLLTEGLDRRDRVAVMVGNRLEYPEIACGIAKAGLVSVPINPRLTTPEVSYILGHSGSRAIIVEQSFLEVAQPAIDEQSVTYVSVLDDNYEDALAASRSNDPRIDVAETDPFTICYTAGTTGKPKGVLLSHRSRTLTFYATALEWGLGPSRTTIGVAPLYHGAGFAFAYAACHTGGTLVMMRQWDPENLLRLVAEERPCSVFLVPAHVQMLRALGDDVLARYDLSSLQTIYTNAAPMPQELKIWLLDVLPWIGLHEVYGSTEAGVVTCLRPPDQLRKERCVGPPWFMTEVRLVSAEGQLSKPNEKGELWSRSPYVFTGYLDDPKATAEATTEDGFVSAGDVAVVDEEGYVYIVDRLRDVIISGGVNVYPRELEDLLLGHPSVRDVAVIGLADEKWGERVVAVVVPNGAAPAEAEVIEYCRANIAGFKVPKEVRFVEALPRSAAGKVLKREIRQTISASDG